MHKQSGHFDADDHGGAEDCSDEKIFGNILKKNKQSRGKAAQEGEGEKIACTRANLILSNPVKTIGLAKEFEKLNLLQLNEVDLVQYLPANKLNIL